MLGSICCPETGPQCLLCNGSARNEREFSRTIVALCLDTLPVFLCPMRLLRTTDAPAQNEKSSEQGVIKPGSDDLIIQVVRMAAKQSF